MAKVAVILRWHTPWSKRNNHSGKQGIMRQVSLKRTLLFDLHKRIAQHCDTVVSTFCALDMARLSWQPQIRGKREWSILQCIDHLNLTHDYYMAKLAAPLAQAPQVQAEPDSYQASFWGGIYMYFSLNPKYTFPSPAPLTPLRQPERSVLAAYLTRQERLLELCDTVAMVDLTKTMVPIKMFVRFNLGDCLKILVYHDALHIRQAQRVYQSSQQPIRQREVVYG